MNLYKRDYQDAEHYYNELTSNPYAETRSEGRWCLALIPAYRGRFEEALRVLDDGLVADRMEQYEGFFSADKHRLKAELLVVRGEYDLAVEEIERCCADVEDIHPVTLTTYLPSQVLVLAECGRFDEAEVAADGYMAGLKEGDILGLKTYLVARAFIDLERGQAEAAVSRIEKAREIQQRRFFLERVALARGYMASGNIAGAVAELERALLRYDDNRTETPTYSVRAHYLLGQAYEESGWANKAIEQYEEFLEIWKDADPGIAEIEDARQRLARLGSDS
jgi:tetratricopeptide (TPR) repeat protein